MTGARICCGVSLALLCAGTAWAGLELNVTPTGAVDQITLDGKLVATNLRLAIVKPNWGANWGDQTESGGLTTTPLQPGDLRAVAGRFDCDGKPCAFEQWIERGAPDANAVRLRWRLVPTADIETESVIVFAALPTAGNAGQAAFIMCDGKAMMRKPLPATLPSPYHLGGADPLAWCGWLLPGDVGLRFEPDGQGITGVALQDDRQFKVKQFSVQFRVRDTRVLKAGQTYEFGLTLRPFTPALLAAEQKPLVDTSAACNVDITSHLPLALRSLRLSAAEIEQYAKLELDLDLDATYENPFDPDDIDVMATFAGPAGETLRVPGFFTQDFQRAEFAGQWQVTPTGNPGWKVRFAPPTPGAWQVTVAVKDRTGQVTCGPQAFACNPVPENPGFVRRSTETDYYLRFDNGRPYFAIGENLCWPPSGALNWYDTWFTALGTAGGNYCRIWLVCWNMALEWTGPAGNADGYMGIGKYSLVNAGKLDWVMDQARKNGIYCMLCFGYHGELMAKEDFFKANKWPQNPYNAANGGPCATPGDIWTDEKARTFYKKRLRYMVARYGWDAHVLAWEFWNETSAPAAWLAEMGAYLKATDPWRHLVTNSTGFSTDVDQFGRKAGEEKAWALPELDFVQAHTYGSDDSRPRTAEAIAELGRKFTTDYAKPFLVGEFGIDWKTGDEKHDPRGVGTSMHDGLWASMMTRCFGVAALWYWDGYVHPFNLYGQFTAVRKFADTVPWATFKPRLAEFGPVSLQVPPGTPWGSATIMPRLGWARATGTDFTVEPNGGLTGQGQFANTLFAENKKDMKTPLRFRVRFPHGGKLVMHVNTVSAGAELHVRLDGREYITFDLPAGEGAGPWKTTKYYEQWTLWQSVYDRDCTVDIPAGEHVLELENTGKDWISIDRYTFAGCMDPGRPQLDLYGLEDGNLAIVWLHDPESNWYNDKLGRAPATWTGLQTSLKGLPDRTYHIEWWDTWKGAPLGTADVASANGLLTLSPPSFTRDIAARIEPAK